MDAVFERSQIHDEKHAYKLKAFEPEIVGVNSRNLNTMKIDLFRFQKLISHLPKNAIYIAESGISSKKDIQFVSELGYQGALIGTSIMEDINLLTMQHFLLWLSQRLRLLLPLQRFSSEFLLQSLWSFI